MSKAHKAAEEFKKFHKMFSGWVDLAAELERVGNLENYAGEISARVDLAKKAEIAAQSSLNQVQEKLKSIEGLAIKLQKDAEEKAVECVKAAEAKAGILVSLAEEKATKISLEAKAEMDLAKDAVEALLSQKTDLLKEIAEGKRVLAEVEAKIKSLKEMLK